jgi:hypothetical protein
MADEPLPALDESFPRRYEARAAGWADTSPDLVYFPYRPGLIVAVTVRRRGTWTGVFAGHDRAARPAIPFLTGLFTTPDEGGFCVVCRGIGYFVDAEEGPTAEWFRVSCEPIRYVLPFPQHGLIVFADFTSFIAYRYADEVIGLEEAWRSVRLGDDELDVLRMTDDRIEGRVWHAPRDQMLGFSLDVRTGEH